MRLVGRNAAMGAAPSTAMASPSGRQLSPAAGDFFNPALEDRLRTMETNIESLAKANNALVSANNALVGENGNLKKAMRSYAAHFSGLVKALKVSYAPDVQLMTPQPSSRTNAPTQPASPGAQVIDATAVQGAPPAGPLQSAAQQVAAAADRMFYGDGESAFYSGGEDD